MNMWPLNMKLLTVNRRTLDMKPLTGKRGGAAWLAVGIGLISLLCSLAYAQPKAAPHPWDTGKIKKLNVSGYPQKHQQTYRLMTKKCGNCHVIARVLNAPYKGQIWASVIKRMIVKPEANISKEEGKRIYDFLIYYSSRK